MNFNVKELSSFLNKISFGNTIMQGVLNFEESGISVKIFDGQVVYTKGFLPNNVVQGYEAIGMIGIKDFNFLIKSVHRFNMSVDIIIDKSTLTLKAGGKKIVIALMEEKFINQPQDIKLEYENKFSILTSQLKSVAEDTRLFSDPILRFETKEGVMSATIKKGTIQESISNDMYNKEIKEGDYVEIRPSFYQGLIKCLSAENVDVEIKKDHPLIMNETFENGSWYKYLIAPIVKEEKKK